MSFESYQDSFSHWDCFRRSLQVVNDFPKFPGLGKLINHILTTLITMPVTASKMFFSPFVKRSSRGTVPICVPQVWEILSRDSTSAACWLDYTYCTHQLDSRSKDGNNLDESSTTSDDTTWIWDSLQRGNPSTIHGGWWSMTTCTQKCLFFKTNIVLARFCLVPKRKWTFQSIILQVLCFSVSSGVSLRQRKNW